MSSQQFPFLSLPSGRIGQLQVRTLGRQKFGDWRTVNIRLSACKESLFILYTTKLFLSKQNLSFPGGGVRGQIRMTVINQLFYTRCTLYSLRLCTGSPSSTVSRGHGNKVFPLNDETPQLCKLWSFWIQFEELFTSQSILR